MRKRFADETSDDNAVLLEGKWKFVVDVFNVIFDRLDTELETRFKSYKKLSKHFSFLITYKTFLWENCVQQQCNCKANIQRI